MPRQGHLEAALYIMGYVKNRYNSKLVFEPSYPNIDHGNFWECDLTDFYEGAVEVIPTDAPLPEGGRGGPTYEGRQQSCR